MYRRARTWARRHGIFFTGFCRLCPAEKPSREPGDQPWMAFAGIFDGTRDGSSTIDAVVDDREWP